MAQAGGALVSALVVATCTAFLCAVVLIGLLALVQSAFFGRRRESRKPFRDVDAVTSGHQLEQQTQCPPAAPSGLPISHVGGTLQPFVVVHELHVGEMWLAKLLQARTGVRVLVGQAKDGKAQKAAQEWLSVVMNAALARQSGRGASHNASRAVGLVLTAPAARKLNLSRRLASVAAQRGVRELPPVSVVSLSRRNRLKHALSRYVRGRPSLRQQRLQGVRVPPSSLLKLAEQGRPAFAELQCAAQALETALTPPPAASGAAAPLGSPRALLPLYYEDLLYAAPKTAVRLWRHLRLDHSGDPPALTAIATEAPTAKAGPNNLCRAVLNYAELCLAARQTSWASDLVASGPGAAGVQGKALCGCQRRLTGMVLGGSHHKTGTLLLERLLQGVAAEVGLPFEKPHWDRCASLQRREDGVCFDEHVTVPKLHRFFLRGSSAQAFVHIVREPLEVCVSSYQYHLRSTEGWLRMPRKELRGKSWQSALRQASTRDGLMLECRRSIRDQIRQQAEVFNATKAHPRVLTLRMEELETHFDQAASRLFRFLLSEAPPNASAALVPPLLAAATQYDTNRHRSELDDGHLSPRHRKVQLRAILLNDTSLATQLANWRRLAGYDASFAAHCTRYGYNYHEESAAFLRSPAAMSLRR